MSTRFLKTGSLPACFKRSPYVPLFFFLLSFAFFLQACTGPGQFEAGEDTGERFSEDLNAVHFVDGREGWAVGTRGSLLHTVNGGASWDRQETGSSRDFMDLFFVDRNNGWIVGEGGIILRTLSAGLSWERQESPVEETLNSVYFTDINMGWAVGDGGTLLYTTDGGLFWLAISDGERRNYNDVWFKDLNHGWIVGEQGLIRYTESSDNGGFWVTQVSGTPRNLRSIYWTGTQAHAVGDSGAILQTVTAGFSGGVNWNALPPGLSNADLMDVFFVRPSKGWIPGSDGRIMHTEDGGQNWSDRSPAAGVPLNAVAFINENIGWAVGQDGTILHTLDGGFFWITQRVR